ncbi:BTB/POZ domain-containing protein 6-like [Pecten maximus]|uniref:BTB/POZ domain-containing protein 6-like n=1 Tax=Pecten maximus TaxID=6579 RepID=UPI0014591659|nr:BTB/POZ domain-containing protein 6-like [Pecten maximus]
MATCSPRADWQVDKPLIECFDHLLTSGIASDVTFIVGEETNRVSAHKLVLMSRSPVFFAMLEGPMAENGEIIIPDISAETFRLFLRYLYTDKLDLTVSTVVPVCYAASKYCVDILVSLCETFLSELLTVDCVCALLEQTHNFKMENLKTKCLRFIQEHAFAILKSESFADLSLECVISIIQSDDLGISERIVYEAVIRWAESECSRRKIEATAENKRHVLGEALYSVRFIHIDEDFLFDRVRADKVLVSEDLSDIKNHKKNKTALKSEKLNTKRRSYIPRKCHRNGVVKNELWKNPPDDEAISFKSSNDLYLCGSGSFLTDVGRSSVDLEVFEDDVSLIQGTKPREQPEPDTPYMADVLFDTPIKIHAGKTYTVLEHSKNKVTHYLAGGNVHVTYQDVTIEFTDSSKSRKTNKNWGQIPYLILSM